MAFGDLADPATITVIVVVVVVVIAIVIFAMRFRFTIRKKPKKPKKPESSDEMDADLGASPFKLSKSVQSNDASQAKDELRILDLEREILSDALRRLYEAHAEGKISEQERERLASSYKARMMAVKESMAKDETIVALHELEDMQEDLMKLFSERFGELTTKVDELRSRINVKPIKEITVKMPEAQPAMPEELETEEEEETETEDEDKQKKKKKPAEKPSTPKTEAEKRIDEIRGEVEKVLDKLGNMEIET